MKEVNEVATIDVVADFLGIVKDGLQGVRGDYFLVTGEDFFTEGTDVVIFLDGQQDVFFGVVFKGYSGFWIDARVCLS